MDAVNKNYGNYRFNEYVCQCIILGMKLPRAKRLLFINNKGGVGKTTIAFNCAAALAAQGFKTVLVDVDPQCNSTNLALGDSYLEDNLFSGENLYTAIRGVFEGGSDIDTKIQLMPSPHTPNLFILPGSIKLATVEDVLDVGFSQAAKGQKFGYFQTSAIHRLLTEIGMREQVDVFILDTSPSLGLLNRAIALSSDYFIVPMNPDSFSVQGVENIGLAMSRWKRDWANTGKAMQADAPANTVLPGDPIFLGYVVNSYNVYGKQPIKTHRNWIGEIPNKVREHLSEKHSRNGLFERSWKEPLATIQDCGQIASLSQEKNKAMFAIQPNELRDHQQGTKDNLSKLQHAFNQLAKNIASTLQAY